MRKSILGMAAMAAASLGIGAVAAPAVGPAPEPRKPTRPRIMARPRMTGFVPANINRWTSKPHEHKREIARRLRQNKSL